MICNFLSFFQVDLSLRIFEDPGAVSKGGTIFPFVRPLDLQPAWQAFEREGKDGFGLNAGYQISEDDYRVYIIQSYSIIVPYILLCSIHPMLRWNFSFEHLLKHQNNLGLDQTPGSRLNTSNVYLKIGSFDPAFNRECTVQNI